MVTREQLQRVWRGAQKWHGRVGKTRVGRFVVRGAISMLVVWVGIGVFVRMARATVYERLLGMGSDMAKFLDDGDTTGRPREIKLNGQKLQISTGSTNQSVRDVLGFYNQRYGGRDGGMRQHFQKMVDDGHTKDPERLKKILARGPLNQISEVRGDGGGDVGFSAFTDLGPPDQQPKALLDRAEKFVKTGQLSDMGAAYYVYARKSGDHTSFFLMWADKDFNVFDMVGGKDGAHGADLPGEDLPNVPRYPGSRRIFSSGEPAKNYAVAGYDVPATPGAAQAFYRSRMTALGWVADAMFDRALVEVRKHKDNVPEHALRFSRGNAHVVVTFEPKDDGSTRMAIAGHTKS